MYERCTILKAGKTTTSDKTTPSSQSELISRCTPSGIENPEKCGECGNDTFTIKIMGEYDGLLYSCTNCGYVHTHWFNE